jgi:hypothetical protein
MVATKITKAQATKLRKALRGKGFTQFFSYGRGQDWTTHDSPRSAYRVLITKHWNGEYAVRTVWRLK